LEKYKQQQMQKFVESPSDGDLRGNLCSSYCAFSLAERKLCSFSFWSFLCSLCSLIYSCFAFSPSIIHHVHVYAAEDKEPVQRDKQLELDTRSSVGQSLVDDAEQDPSDVYDPSFTVGKSPMHNGASTPERNNGGVGGLGAGTPKVRH